MDFKELIKFGLEESSEPIIKNPVLRDAMAEGGRMGFWKAGSVKKAQQAGNVAKQQVRFDRIAKLFKDKDWTGLKTQTRPARIKAGTQVDTGGKLISQDTKMLNDIIEGGTKAEKTALAKKLGITREKMIDGWKKSKSKIATELSENLSKQQLKKVEFQKKLYNEISTNPGTIKQMAKRLKVDEKYLVQQSSKLLKNVYTQNVAIAKTPKFDLDARGKKTLKSWLPNDFKSTDNFLDNFANIDGLKKVQTENMGILIRNAYRNNPKKYTEALKSLGDYNKFVNSLPKGTKVDLDHPLSKAFLKGSGVSPDKLLHITPVDRGFNRGFKKQLGDKYTKALNMTDPILKKEAIKNVRNLANRTGINIGDVTGKKYDYGTTHLLDKKKNFQKEYFKNIKEQNLVADNLKELKKTKEGRKIIKDVFPTGKVQVKKIDGEKIKKQLLRLGGCGLYAGGRVGFKNGSKCINRAIAKLKSGKLNASEKKIVDAMGDGLKKIGGKGGMPKGFWTTALKGEGYFALADFANNLTKGQSLDKSFTNAIKTATFGLADFKGNERDLLKYAKERGLDTEAIKQWMDYGKTYGKYEKAYEDMDSATEILASDEIVGPDDSMLQTSVIEQTPSRIKKLDEQLTEKEKQESIYSGKGSKDFNEAIEGVIAREWNKTAGTPLDRGYRKMVGMKGDEGLVWGGLGALTREGMEDLGFGEYDSLKGFTPQKIMNYHPVYGYKEDIKDVIREGDSPMEDMLMFMEKYYPSSALLEEAARDKMGIYDYDPNLGYNYAGGGIAGIRRPSAIPPESGPTPYGLPSMLNRVKRV